MGGIYVFTLAQVPVWISPWYLLIALMFSQRVPGVAGKLTFAAAMTLGLLVHEFGHALVARHFKLNPKVLLHGMGGVCAHDRAQGNGQDAMIIAAGPLAGLALSGLAWGLLQLHPPPPKSLGFLFLETTFTLHLFWSIFNLIPLWPMDGGQLFRLGMLRLFAPGRAEKITHVTALLILGGFAMWLGPQLGMWSVLLLALFGVQNVRAMREGSGMPVRRENKYAAELLVQAHDAYTNGDDDDAIRLCHRLRAEGNVPEKVLDRTWQILGIATARKHEYREALSYLKRAPADREVVEALAQCFYQLDMWAELRQLTESPGFQALPTDTRQLVLDALQDVDACPAT